MLTATNRRLNHNMSEDTRFDVPIIMIVFKRPDLTRRVLQAVTEIRPRRLLVVADGPNQADQSEEAACRQTQALFDDLPPEIVIEREFAKQNMGLRRRVSSGLSWAFERVERGIILEDDCVPTPSFFPYCKTLLERFETDERVGAIAGCNVESVIGRARVRDASYRFSSFGSPWGWATWADRWDEYDTDLALWPSLRDSGWFQEILGKVAGDQWAALYANGDNIESWYIRWLLTMWAHQRLWVIPTENQIVNIGVGPDATHTSSSSVYAKFDRLPTRSLSFPLRHPTGFPRDLADEKRRMEALLPWSPRRRALAQFVYEGHGRALKSLAKRAR